MAMEDQGFVVEIERLLRLEDVPASPPPQQQEAPVDRARGYQLGKLLHAAKVFIDKHNANAVEPVDELFVDYAKSTATAYAGIFNTLNFFGATASWMIKSSHHLNNHENVKTIFMALAIVFLPFSLIVLGMANSLKPKASMKTWMNIVAVMLFAEIALMGAMLGFFAYYLIDQSDLATVLTVAIVGSTVLIMVPWMVYGRPRLLPRRN